MKVWKIGVVGCREHITLEVYVRHLVILEDLLLVNLL